MKILIVSATKKEIEPLLHHVSGIGESRGNLLFCRYRKLNVDILITGAGMVSTAYYCAKTLSDAFDFTINAGIAGSFIKDLKIGDVVQVTGDCFAELGAENGERFLTLKEMSLSGTDKVENNTEIKNPVLQNLKRVSGITVNKVHGNESSIKEVVERFHPDVETMEGAAFLYSCAQEGIPCAQVRAISNYVEKRKITNWNIPLAIKNLNETMLNILDNFQ